MAFRRDESISNGWESALRYLVPKGVTGIDRSNLVNLIDDITVRCGPVIDRYPSWHPLVSNHNGRHPFTYPCEENGYKGLDHNIYFANGFITCPYGKAQTVIDSVNALPYNQSCDHVATIEAEEINTELYAENTTPVLVTCNWTRGNTLDRTIPKDLAVPLMLEAELPEWRTSACGETWETMRPYFLGEPCGKRSSVFIDQEVGQMMKKTYEMLIYSGMFGPLKV